MDSIYQDNILDHYHYPRNFGKLDNPDLSGMKSNPLCGDKIGFDVKLQKENGNKKISQISFWGEGCALSMAAASMLTELSFGMDVNDIKSITKEQLFGLIGIKQLTTARVKCVLLPLEVLHQLVIPADRK